MVVFVCLLPSGSVSVVVTFVEPSALISVTCCVMDSETAWAVAVGVPYASGSSFCVMVSLFECVDRCTRSDFLGEAVLKEGNRVGRAKSEMTAGAGEKFFHSGDRYRRTERRGWRVSIIISFYFCVRQNASRLFSLALPLASAETPQPQATATTGGSLDLLRWNFGRKFLQYGNSSTFLSLLCPKVAEKRPLDQ